MSLHSDFHNISRVSDRYANRTSGQTSSDFLKNRWVLSRGQRATKEVSDGDIKANSEASKDELSLKTWCEAIKQRECSLFSCNSLHSSDESLVLGRLTGGSLLNLESNLRRVDWNGAAFSNHGSARCHKDISEEKSSVGLAWSLLSIH